MRILEKGGTGLNLTITSKIASAQVSPFYFGAGWDNPDGPVDLDIVCVALTGGKLTDENNLVYFNRREAPGINLSKDNTTGEGEGDDENIVIDPTKLDPSIDSVVVGLACYSDTDFSKAPNPHFRACDGADEAAEQMADVPAGSGEAEDTVLVAFKLNKTDEGWIMNSVGDFHKKGTGTNAISGFAELYK